MNLIQSYADAVKWLSQSTGWADAMLHVNAGLAILAISAVVMRRAPGEWPTFSVVAAAAIANEAIDYLHHGGVMPDTLSDLSLTIFWPAVFLAMHAFARARLGTSSRESVAAYDA